jgi:hypothetical protein
MRGDVSALSVKKRVNSVVFQIMLTVGNRDHEFVILSAFAAHLTDYLNSRSPVSSMLHACYENNNKVYLLFHILPTNQPCHI